MDDKPKNQIEYLRGRPIDDALTVIAHRDAQCEYQQAEIGKLQAEVERLKISAEEQKDLLLKFKEHFQSTRPIFSRASAVSFINSVVDDGE